MVLTCWPMFHMRLAATYAIRQGFFFFLQTANSLILKSPETLFYNYLNEKVISNNFFVKKYPPPPSIVVMGRIIKSSIVFEAIQNSGIKNKRPRGLDTLLDLLQMKPR